MSVSLTNNEPFQLVDMSDVEHEQSQVRIDAQELQTRPMEKLNSPMEKLDAPMDAADAITYTSMCDISDMKSRDSYDQSVHTKCPDEFNGDAILAEFADDEKTPAEIFGQNRRTVRYARLVLIRIKYAVATVKYASPRQKIPAGFLTQLVIDCHVAVVAEMMRIKKIEPSPRDIITFVYASFEEPGVSDLSGSGFLMLSYSDRVMSVLSVARAVVAPIWYTYCDMVYAECHRQLDRQALFYVQSKMNRGRRIIGCCLTM